MSATSRIVTTPVGTATPATAALAWFATAVAAACVVALVNRFRRRRHPAYLIWAVALGCFSLGSAAEAWARLHVWTELTAKLFYLFGAGLTAGLLGTGTLLLAAPRVGRIAVALAGIAAAVIAWQVVGAPVDAARLPMDGFEAIHRPAALRLPVILMNVLGSTAVLVPTVVSVVRAVRARESWSRTWALGLIAGGVFIVASGHSVAGGLRLAPAAAISLVNALGVTLIFAGQILPAADAWAAAQRRPLRAA